MTTIPLKIAHQILKESPAIAILGTPYRHEVSKLTGKDDNQFFYIEQIGVPEDSDEDAVEFEDGSTIVIQFLEGPNREVEIRDDEMFLIDRDGDEISFQVLTPMSRKSLLEF